MTLRESVILIAYAIIVLGALYRIVTIRQELG